MNAPVPFVIMVIVFLVMFRRRSLSIITSEEKVFKTLMSESCKKKSDYQNWNSQLD
jgi:hypothetical protein